MGNEADEMLIKRYIAWCVANDFNQTEMGKFIKRTRSWASLLINGKITRLQFITRNRIKAILGIQ